MTDSAKHSAISLEQNGGDDPLWRTRVDAQKEASLSAADSSRLELSDNSLWRTRVGRPSEETAIRSSPDLRTTEEPPARYSSGLELTDCSLWRTRVRLSSLQLEEREAEQPTASTRLDLSDNSLWRTHVTAAESEVEEPPLHTTTKLVDFSTNEADESTVGSLPPSIGRPPAQKARVSMRLSALQPVVEEESLTPAPAPAFVGLQSPVDVTMRTADSDGTPRRSSAARSLGYAESTVASRARSVADRSAASTPDSSPMCARHAHGRMPRESVEVFTQTSGHEGQLLEERRPGNPLTQNFRPLSPRRRATLMQPPRVPAARPSVFAPFFSRVSSASEQSSRQSVEFSDRSLTRSPATKIPAPLRLPSTPNGSPRLADRVRMNEALKLAGASPRSARSRLPTRSPATPPAADRPTASGDALRSIRDAYTTPERTPQAARPGVFDFTLESTPPSRRVADSMFETSSETPKSGRIESQPLRLPANHRALPWNEDAAGSLFDSATDPPPVASQPIGSQVPQRPPFRLLNDDDFCTSTPPPSRRSRAPAAVESPVVRPVVALPESLRFDDHTPLEAPSFDFSRAADSTAGVSFAAGGSDCDSDVGSPAPKHIVLRAPRHNMVGSENDNPNPALRRSTRTRLTRACNRGLGERPLYARDADGNFRLVGVQEGRTADPLCRKWGTFDKDKALQLDRDAAQRRRVVKQQNKRKWERDFPPLPADLDDE
ncbi:hypothetical protein M3Y99_01553400 [Aphelenchoides fujianensis]|nr:hypothetical protein M3Y99_01553400 [Aphelenchoides fujianensis]